jgi:hypothetical protein
MFCMRIIEISTDKRYLGGVIKHKKLAIILGLIGVFLSAPVLLFFARSPVLIVTDVPFTVLHGASNLRRQQASASRTLFRRVKPVKVADGVSPDMVSLAIMEASAEPFCVLFSRSQADAAKHFHDRFPEIPVVLLSGLLPVPNLPPPDGFFCEYVTDREIDLYRAGLFAAILGDLKKTDNKEEPDAKAPARTYVLRQDRLVQTAERDLFTQGIKEHDPEALIVFANTAGQVPDMKGISSIVLTGVGGDFLEKNPRIPVILFTWLDPALTAWEVVVQFDDSAWALAVPAVRMALKGEDRGKIPSKPLIFPKRITDKNILRLLEKSAKKTP